MLAAAVAVNEGQNTRGTVTLPPGVRAATQRILDRAAPGYSPSAWIVTRSAPRPGATVTRRDAWI